MSSEWTSTVSCEVTGNVITLEVDELESKDFSLTDKIRLTLKNIPNPQMGLLRDSEQLVYDTHFDKGYQFFDFWTTNFEVLIVNAALS